MVANVYRRIINVYRRIINGKQCISIGEIQWVSSDTVWLASVTVWVPFYIIRCVCSFTVIFVGVHYQSVRCPVAVPFCALYIQYSSVVVR